MSVFFLGIIVLLKIILGECFMEDKILEIKKSAVEEINSAKNLKDLDEVKNKYLSVLTRTEFSTIMYLCENKRAACIVNHT